LRCRGRGRLGSAFDTLPAAERDVPEELRYRPSAQHLTRDLLAAPPAAGCQVSAHSLPGLVSRSHCLG